MIPLDHEAAAFLGALVAAGLGLAAAVCWGVWLLRREMRYSGRAVPPDVASVLAAVDAEMPEPDVPTRIDRLTLGRVMD